MFEGKDMRFASAGVGGSVALADAMITPLRQTAIRSWVDRISELDLVPDLGEDIGSVRWFRGLGTLTVLSVCALALLPDFGPVFGAQPPLQTEAEFEEARAQMIMPIAYGSDSGKRMAATDTVIALAGSPERPRIELTATLGRGDSFSRFLQRAGVRRRGACYVTSRGSGVTPLGWF